MGKHVARIAKAADPIDIRVRCPHCGDWAHMEETPLPDLVLDGVDARFGIRFCPNRQCPPVFVLHLGDGDTRTFPKGKPTIPLDASDLPRTVKRSFVEAYECYEADAFRAAVMMIRRTLEEACEDQGATGKDLWERIENLKPRLLLSQDLYAAMHELRILGSDAAHVESRYYEDVTAAEAEIAIQFAAEILRSLYSHPVLLEKLKSRKRQASGQDA